MTSAYRLQQLARELSLPEDAPRTRPPGTIQFAGWLSQPDCKARLNAADCLVLPSLFECGGAVVLEAMALGKPVIATAWGGPLDYLDADCGILVQPVSLDGLVDGLAAAMLEIGAVRRRSAGAWATRAVAKIRSHYSWKGKVGQMIEFYDAARRSGARSERKGAGRSRLMRILILSDVSGFMPGGVPAETRELIGGLARSRPRAGLRRRRSCHGRANSRVTSRSRFRSAARFAGKSPPTLDEFKPDFVHVICMSSRGVLALAPLLRPHPWALTVHSVSPYERKLRFFHRHEDLHYALRSLRCLPNSAGVALGPVERQGAAGDRAQRLRRAGRRTLRLSGAPHRARLVAVPAAAAAMRGAQARPLNGELQLTTVGGLAHTKGQHDVIKALPELVRRFPRVRYQLIGEIRDDSYVRWLKRLAIRLGVADRLLFSVDLDQAAKVEALRRADVYVQPSHEEGFCLSYAEAAAVVPRLVGTRTGAIAAMSRDDPRRPDRAGARSARARRGDRRAGRGRSSRRPHGRPCRRACRSGFPMRPTFVRTRRSMRVDGTSLVMTASVIGISLGHLSSFEAGLGEFAHRLGEGLAKQVGDVQGEQAQTLLSHARASARRLRPGGGLHRLSAAPALRALAARPLRSLAQHVPAQHHSAAGGGAGIACSPCTISTIDTPGRASVRGAMRC